MERREGGRKGEDRRQKVRKRDLGVKIVSSSLDDRKQPHLLIFTF